MINLSNYSMKYHIQWLQFSVTGRRRLATRGDHCGSHACALPITFCAQQSVFMEKIESNHVSHSKAQAMYAYFDGRFGMAASRKLYN